MKHDPVTGRGEREYGLDLLRGGLLALMFLNHLDVVFFTASPRVSDYLFEVGGYVSAAEGFMLLSGFVAGRGAAMRRAGDQGPAPVWRAAQRVAKIYLAYCGTCAAMYAFFWCWGAPSAAWGTWVALCLKAPADAALSVAAMRFDPLYLEILQLYMICVALLPILERALRRGLFSYIFSISFLLWAGGLASPLSTWGGGGSLRAISWQCLFVTGFLLGSRGYVLRKAGNLATYLAFGAISGLGCMLLLRHAGMPMADWLIDRSRAGPLRVLTLLLYCALSVVWLASVKPSFMVEAVASLGRHSLLFFCAHILVLHGLSVLLVEASSSRLAFQLLVAMLSLSAMAGLILAYDRWRGRTRPGKSPACEFAAKSI